MNDLLPRVAQQDPSAIEECIDRYGGLVFSIARRLLRNEADAEEAVQDVFADVWASAHKYDPAKASEKTMVTMIARRRLIDRLRKAGRRPQTESLETPASLQDETTDTGVETRDDVARIQTLIDQLKPEQKRVLKLSIYEGWTHQKISEELGIPLGTIKTHLRRALIFLREMAQIHGLAPEGGFTP